MPSRADGMFGSSSSSSTPYRASTAAPIPLRLPLNMNDSDDELDSDYDQNPFKDPHTTEHEHERHESDSSFYPSSNINADSEPGSSAPLIRTFSKDTDGDSLDRKLPSTWDSPGPPPVKRKRWTLLCETFYPDSFACRLYLVVVVIETLFDLVTESFILVRASDAASRLSSNGSAVDDAQLTSESALILKRIMVYLSIFGIAHIFQFMLALDAVYHKNVLQFISLAIFNALFVVFAITQRTEAQFALEANSPNSKLDVLLPIAILIVVSLAEIAYIGLGYKIYREFGWQIFKLLGADISMRGTYVQYQIFQCFLRFDVFFWLAFMVQRITLALDNNNVEFYMTIIALPLPILHVYLGHLAATRESRPMMAVFGFGCFLTMFYFCYKLFRIWNERDTTKYHSIYKLMVVFATISIALVLLTSVWAVLVYRNFDQGLAGHLTTSRQVRRDELELARNASSYPRGDARLSRRFSIEIE